MQGSGGCDGVGGRGLVGPTEKRLLRGWRRWCCSASWCSTDASGPGRGQSQSAIPRTCHLCSDDVVIGQLGGARPSRPSGSAGDAFDAADAEQRRLIREGFKSGIAGRAARPTRPGCLRGYFPLVITPGSSGSRAVRWLCQTKRRPGFAMMARHPSGCRPSSPGVRANAS